jgi:hypothetical protein
VLFAHAGLSGAEISLLFTIWSAVGIVAEVPTGVLADRVQRRHVLAAAGVLQAAAYGAWTVWPDFAGFALGFVLWGIGGSLVSGALEALVYDGLAERKAAARFPAVLGRIRSAGLLAQLPAAGAASVLVVVGGYPLVGWASVGTCLGAAVLAWSLPEPVRSGMSAEDLAAEESGQSYLATLRSGLREITANPAVRAAVVAVAALAGIDACEEYVPLLASAWSVPLGLLPLAGLGLPVAGALGAATAGRLSGVRGRGLGILLGTAAVLLAVAALAHQPAALIGVFAFYGLYQLVDVTAAARLQQRIGGAARATVSSVAALLSELSAFAIYAAWALGGATGLAVVVAAVAVGLPRWLREAPHLPDRVIRATS